jgi:CubicO group peptidase (beta-lactamase class C family)
MMFIRYWVVASLLLGSTNSFSQSHPFQKTLPKVDAYIDTLMKDWNIPGLAVAIVYKDQLIYAKGYGYRDIDKQLPVTAATLFPIASNTKLMTATVGGILAEEGKLDLDQPATRYMPTLRFISDELNDRVTVRDMLSHRTGLSRNDGIWIAASFSRAETIQKIRYMKPALGHHEGYLYNNMMFVAAGGVMEQVTGKSWENLIREKLFGPLDMKSSCFTDAEMTGPGNYALCYFEVDSTRRLLPKKYSSQTEALGPAGTVRSNLEDMSHWIIAQLNGGQYRQKTIFSDKVWKQTLTPINISDREGKYDELSNALYGLGRTLYTYKGLKVTSHTGSIDGYFSNLTILPKEQIGIFMVHNSAAGSMIRPIMTYPIVDLLFNLGYTPWSQRYQQLNREDKALEKRREDSIKATKVNGTRPSHNGADYAGNYISDLYGPLQIEIQQDTLYLQFRKVRSRLLHFHYDQFYTEEKNTDLPEFRMQFTTDLSGKIDKVVMSVFGDPSTEFIRVR